jgi:hypothetical protein
MSFLSKFLVILLCLMLLIPITAQDNTVTVPDVTGLSPAQAAAELNRAGLLLGTIAYDAPVAVDDANPDYSIVEQSPNQGENVEAGTTVDVTLNYYNVLLRYDGNEFHFINLSGVDIGLHNLSFETANRRFEARRWGDTARTGFCVQAWTINVNNFFEPQECGFVQGGIGVLRSLPENQQFWIHSEAETFRIIQNGILRGECPVAQDSAEDEPEDTCPVWLASNQPPEDMTEYLYFVYDAHHFYIHNRSANQWMPLASITFSDTTRSLLENRFFDFEPRTYQDFLAPQQCLHISDGTTIAEDAEQIVACDVVVQSTYASDDRFWLDGFSVTGVLDVASARQCPAVAGDEPSVCLIPR